MFPRKSSIMECVIVAIAIMGAAILFLVPWGWAI